MRDWLQERAAYYGVGRPTFDGLIAQGVDKIRAEAEAIIAEFESIYGKLPPGQREDAVQAAVRKIEARERGY